MQAVLALKSEAFGGRNHADHSLLYTTYISVTYPKEKDYMTTNHNLATYNGINP